MIVKPVEKAAEQYVKKSTMAFLEGEKNLKWITGVLAHSGLSREGTISVIGPLRNYGDNTRAQALFDWLGSANW